MRSVHRLPIARPAAVSPEPPEPPHDIQLEQLLLGALLNDERAVERLPPGFDNSAFFDPINAAIFDAILSLAKTGQRPSAQALGPAFESWPPIDDDCSLPQYVERLEINAVTTRVENYAEGLIELALERLHANGPTWQADLLRTKSGAVRPLLANAISAFSGAPEWHWVLGHNDLTLKTTVLRPTPWDEGPFQIRAWTPTDDALAADWLQRQHVPCGIEIVQQAIETVAHWARFHPVRQYLSRLKWDGTARVDRFASTYLGTAPSPYAAAISRCWLISAVARVMRPGCKVDHVLILEGPQGAGKSTAAGILGGQWFTDELSDVGSKDAAMQSLGAWIIELSELDALSRSDISKMKAFISRSTDRFRPPYGRRVIESNRQCVFVGTTNSEAYLRDETGGRRFWPIKVGRIDRDALRRDRDQIWAEALVRFDRGEQWWLRPEETTSAAVEQSARFEEDAWLDRVEDLVQIRSEVSVQDVLKALGLVEHQWTPVATRRVGVCLKRLGWERHQKRGPDGRRHWIYRRQFGDIELAAA